MDLKPGGDAMQLTYSCPTCGQDEDFPWSMVGKPATCRRCSQGFVVPAPFEPRKPRSAQAIPVVKDQDPPPSPAPRTVRSEVPPPAPPPARTLKIEGLTAAQIARLREAASEAETQPEPAPKPRRRSHRDAPGSGMAAFVPTPVQPSRPPSSRPARIEASPPEPSDSVRDGSEIPWPHHARARGSESGRARDAFAPEATRPVPPQSPRPAWLVPAIAGGGVALLLTLNIGFYVAFVGFGRKWAEPARIVEPSPADTTGLGALAKAPVEAAPEESASPAPIVGPPAAPSKKPARAFKPKEVEEVAEGKPAEEVPDRVMSASDIASKYEASVALIKVKKGSGTGFIARAGIVATNSHVIDAERVKDIQVSFPTAPEGQQGPYSAKLLHQDKGRDLALLGVATDLPPVRLAGDHKLRKGDDVTVIGSPGVGGKVLENAICRGIFSSMTKLNGYPCLQLNISVNPGNSGGPVFDPKGRVIGVVTAKGVNKEGMAFAVPIEDLLSALDTAESAARAGVGPARRPSASALGYGFKAGQAYVYSVEPTVMTSNGLVTLAGTSIYRVKGGVREELFDAIGWLSPTEKAAEAIIPQLGPEETRAWSALRAIVPPAEGPLLRVVEGGSDIKLRHEACRVPSLVGTSRSLPALERLAARFSKNFDQATQLGKKFPGVSEVPLLAIAQGGGEPQWRGTACRTLGQIGTPAALPGLQALAARDGDDSLARLAEDAIQAIKARP